MTASLHQHLQQSVITTSLCWQIKTVHGLELGFTEHNENLHLNGIIYHANNSLCCSAIESSRELRDSNIEIEAVIDEYLRIEDITSGHYDNAAIEIFLVNFIQPELGKIVLFCGVISSIKLSNNLFIAKLRSNGDYFNNTVGEIYSPSCRADFCDHRCKLSKELFTLEGTISAVIDEVTFFSNDISKEDGFYNYGQLQMLEGENTGLSLSIKDSSSGTIMLTVPAPHLLNIGDKFAITAGCDKKFETCVTRFNNAINFRGEPNIPGYDGLV